MQTLKKIGCTSVTDVHASFCLFFNVKNIFKLNSLMFLLIKECYVIFITINHSINASYHDGIFTSSKH